jgi:hypothetical protein
VDPEGLRLPGVVVTARSRELQGIRSATTSGNGDYIIPFLPSGDYTVTFELNGFQTLTRSERISSGQAVQLSVSMKLAAVTETVTVRGQPAGDFSQTAPVVTSFKSDLLRRLPVTGYVGTPAFLLTLLEKARERGLKDREAIRHALIRAAIQYPNGAARDPIAESPVGPTQEVTR